MTRTSEPSSSSNRTSPDELRLTRRQAIQAATLGAGALALGASGLGAAGSARAAHHEAGESENKPEAFELSEQTLRDMDKSPLVYVSPLHSDGRESTCHGEVWFHNDNGTVLLLTGTKAWKAEAIRTRRDRARIWVGDFGPVKSAGDRFRKAPTFLAKAERELDAEAFGRLMTAFADKYPNEWGKWKPRFQAGWDDGSRTLIRYTPIAP